MDFETINNKMNETIEKIYLNFILKALKIFQVILSGYNASQYKSLQSFREYGWKVFPGPINNGMMDFTFQYHIPHLNSNVDIYMVKNLKTGILGYDPFLPLVYTDVVVDKNDVIFDTIKQLESVTEIGVLYEYGNNLVTYSITNLVEKYGLTIYYKK